MTIVELSGNRRTRSPDRKACPGEWEHNMRAMQTCIPLLEIIYRKVEADSQFSLDYLRAVDAVIDVATDVRNNAETAQKVCSQVLARLTESGGYEEPVDPTGELTPKSLSAEAAVKATIRALQVLDRSTLPAGHAEDVSDSNEEAIATLQRLHNTLVDLRWAVIEHDADLEKPEGEAFDNIEELVADLRSR